MYPDSQTAPETMNIRIGTPDCPGCPSCEPKVCPNCGHEDCPNKKKGSGFIPFYPGTYPYNPYPNTTSRITYTCQAMGG